MDLDAVIAQATQDVATEQKASEEATKAEITPQEPSAEPAQETEADISKKPDDALTPEQLVKREKNRESHLNSKLAQMKRANRDLQAQLAQQQAPKPQATETGQKAKPNPQDPYYKDKTWEQYNEDLTDWKLEQKFSVKDKETEDTKKAEQFNTWRTEQSDRTAKQAAEAFQKLPDFKDLFEANYDTLETFDNTHIEQAFYEAENPEMAAYALMKEGKLESLLQMSPARAAMEIAKAEDRGRAYLKTGKTATNAPTPISSAKGNSTGGKSLQNQSVDEVMKSLGFRS